MRQETVLPRFAARLEPGGQSPLLESGLSAESAMMSHHGFAGINSRCPGVEDLCCFGRYFHRELRSPQPKVILQVRHLFASRSLAYSALAWLMTGRSESASFQSVRSSW
jgi:hypothetical protein